MVEKSDLIERVWPGVFVTEANLTQNVFSLRKCLGEKANDNRYIVTVPGQGYSFAGELRRIERFATAEMPIVAVPEPPPRRGRPTPDPRPAAARAVPGRSRLIARRRPPAPLRRRSAAGRRAAARSGGCSSGPAWAWWRCWCCSPSSTSSSTSALRRAPRTAGPRPARPVRQAIAVLDFKSLSPSAETRWLRDAPSPRC